MYFQQEEVPIRISGNSM